MSLDTSATPSAAADDAVPSGSLVDPRGLRFAATVTAIVLALVLITANAWLLAAQALIFALGAFDQPPYGLLFRRFIRPRLSPPAALEDARPPRFAQALGLVFALVGLLGFALGSTVVGLVAPSSALAVLFLIAAFGCCLGCVLYLFSHETSASGAAARHKEGSA